MDKDIEFVKGLIVKAPHERAPDFVKASIAIKVDELGMWLREKHKAGQEWVNLDVKVAKSGKWYASVSQYKKEPSENDRARGQEVQQEQRARSKGGSSIVGGKELEDDIPFASCSLSADVIFGGLRWPAE